MGCEVLLEDVRKVYSGGLEALRGISLRVSPGEKLAIMGPNGSGKTTLLQVLAGVTRPSGGRVEVCDFEVWGDGWAKARELIGFSPQEPPFNPRLSVIENLVVLGGLMGIPRGTAAREARRLLRELGLEGLEGVKVARLSGGQRRRAAVALALLPDPEVVILDEPGSGLDPAAKRRLWEDAGGLLKGRTVVFSTHDPLEAEEAPDMVAIISRGLIAAVGRPRELIERYSPRPRVRVWAPKRPADLKPVREAAGFAEYEVEGSWEIPRILSAYAEEGVEVSRAELVRPGLREVFFEVTGEEFEPEGA